MKYSFTISPVGLWSAAALRSEPCAAFTESDAWITDSYGYSSNRDLLWSRADTVIWLDYSRWVVMWRVTRRTVLRRIRREVIFNGNIEPPLRTFFTDRDHILRWAWSSYTPRRRDMARRRADPAYRHLTCMQLRSPRQAEGWLATVTGGNGPG